jgi:2-desacetyl-2-hydroxyethyl bacteriochlorophyllide A dehydrogenase
MANRLAVYFTAPRQVEVRAQDLPEPGPGQVQVQALLSAISPGSELLIYRGQVPQDLPLDDSIAVLSGGFSFPLQYGYSLVGRVAAVGPAVDTGWLGKLVFAFHPHSGSFNINPQELLPLPDGVHPEDAVFLPNMETAVNLAMDGRPLIGERVVVLGQGIVGLLCTALLARFPLGTLVTLDRYARRRQVSLALGAAASLDPDDPNSALRLREALAASQRYDGADLVFELSGVPEALNLAITAAGFGGRIVVGSWYGSKRAPLELGGRFHRARLQLISSQVSSLAPEFSARWTKTRRLNVAWEALRTVQPSQFVTHRFPVERAAQAYELLDTAPEKTVQVLLTY